MLDNVIRGRIDPIIVSCPFSEEVDDRPGIIYVDVPEPITIIPLLQGRQGLFFIGILSYLSYFFFRKSHDIGIGIIKDWADTEIVQAAEDALFGNAQDTGEDGEIQELVLLWPSMRDWMKWVLSTK